VKGKLYISLVPLVILLFLINPSTSYEQVATATVRVTLTVIPGPGIGFSPQHSPTTSSPVNRRDDGGITLHASTPVDVSLMSTDRGKTVVTNHLDKGETRTLTSRDLVGVSKVEVVYLGS
jgi:hypothetical protein